MKKNSTEQYKGKTRGIVPLAVNVDEEAVQLLRHLAPPRGLGQYIARLVYEHVARIEERHWLLQEYRAVDLQRSTQIDGRFPSIDALIAKLRAHERDFSHILDAQDDLRKARVFPSETLTAKDYNEDFQRMIDAAQQGPGHSQTPSMDNHSADDGE